MQKKQEQELIESIQAIKDKICNKEPKHFGFKDIVHSFFGSLIFSLTFALKGLLVQVAVLQTLTHQIMIILSTLLILTAEIYFIGYSRVKNKQERPFLQFWIKRLLCFYGVTILVSFFIVYIFGLNELPEIGNTFVNVIKLITVLSMPAAVGAGISDLVKSHRYG